MLQRTLICTLLSAVLMPAWLPAEELPPKLDGKWTVTKLTIDGTELPVRESPDAFWFEVEGNVWRYSFVVNGERANADFKVSQTKNDAGVSIDAKFLSGAFADRVCKGIYRIDGNVATLCIGDSPSTPRPTRFECPAKSGLQLFELKRAKPTEP